VVRLADGVVAGRDLRVWASGPDGVPVVPTAAGAPVAVGPFGADPAAALASLSALVAAGGVAVAGAGVDLGDGFRSARLEGARGDRRDAVLAALRILGLDGAGRIGARAAVLVALFGAAATKRVGAAAEQAIRDGRWNALHLASAASDVLGPEQLETVLGWTGGGPVPEGAASDLAQWLDQVLGGLPRPRRLALLRDLWERVEAVREGVARTERRQDMRARQDRYAELVVRHRRFVDDWLTAQFRAAVGRDVTLARALRWMPAPWQWQRWLGMVLHDALTATALMRAALAVADHGMADGLALVRAQVATAPVLMTDDAAGAAARRVPGLTGIPARPGCYLRELDTRLAPDVTLDWPTVSYFRARLVRARDYGLMAVNAAALIFQDLSHVSPAVVRDWTCPHLAQWRAAAGYTDIRAPRGWEQPSADPEVPSLARRLRAAPDADPASVEEPGDLLWYAELCDALAQLEGYDAAEVVYASPAPRIETHPPSPEPDPLRPRLDSVPLAVAGAAQLVALGARVPERPRTWVELVDGLMTAAVLVEALTGTFPVPAPLADRDGATVPGTGLRAEVARDPQMLAGWAAYMGNCIAGPGYVAAAAKGRCVLVALRDPDGRVVANLELLPRRTSGGWQVGEFRARFNADPDGEVDRPVRAWVETIPATPARVPAPSRPHGPGRPHRRGRLAADVGEALDRLTAQALAEPAIRRALAVLRDPVPLRRLGFRTFTEGVRGRLADRPRDLPRLWRAAGVAPLRDALAGLDAAVRERYGQLDRLGDDPPLPRALHRLARRPEVTRARAVDLLARRYRLALGTLARDGDPALSAAIGRCPDPSVLSALVLAVTFGRTPDLPVVRVPTAARGVVPGFPQTALADPLWQAAWPDGELTADPQWWRRPVTLLVPAAWLGTRDWPALWQRANR
jgi:hypothetical protein